MTGGAKPQKTAEMQLLETVAADVHEIKQDLKLFDRERLVLRSQVLRSEVDIAKLDKTVTDHEKKINYFMGGSMVMGVIIGFLIRQFDKVKGIFG